MTTLKFKCVEKTERVGGVSRSAAEHNTVYVYTFVAQGDNPFISGRTELVFLEPQHFRVMGDYNLNLSSMVELAGLN